MCIHAQITPNADAFLKYSPTLHPQVAPHVSVHLECLQLYQRVSPSNNVHLVQASTLLTFTPGQSMQSRGSGAGGQAAPLCRQSPGLCLFCQCVFTQVR